MPVAALDGNSAWLEIARLAWNLGTWIVQLVLRGLVFRIAVGRIVTSSLLPSNSAPPSIGVSRACGGDTVAAAACVSEP
jgi:hypothetical protein